MVEPVALETAWRWIDENAHALGAESVGLEAALGRIPVEAPLAASDVPATACAIEDGYAVRAEATVGATAYNRLSFAIAEADALPDGMVAPIGAGQPLPGGANAVVPADWAELEGDRRVSVLAAVAEGAGVATAACELRAGEPLWPSGRRRPLRAAEIGLLGAAGIERVAVARRPRARILIAGTARAPDVLGPMLRALIARDGGTVVELAGFDAGRERGADVAADADVVVVARAIEGSPGAGIDATLAGDAESAIRGVAIEPGRGTCLARLDDTIIALLPDLPAACFWSYELIAARALRRRGGRDPAFPFASRRCRTTRKIASPLGLTEVVPVRLDPAAPGAITPFPSGPSPRLRDAASADGFVLVAAASEGCPAGAELPVWLFGPVVDDVQGHG
jgi:molybdopterin molybdotransferase